ncbi:MAG: AAA family ATPase, partial [Gordonibacter sp.]|uniref:AAA family ATPase n=1 Tax=Gordonibacter sp. TaxID=1968902 RepID=UPI002FC5C4C1
MAREFGKNEYRSCLFIDFYRANDDVKALFRDLADDLDSLFSYLAGLYNVQLHERDTLVVLDEVQFFPHARAMVKYFVEDGRYDFIETGSLVSIKQNTQDILIPSEEVSFELNPFDFEDSVGRAGKSGSRPSSNRPQTTDNPCPTRCIRRPRAYFESTCSWAVCKRSRICVFLRSLLLAIM